MKKLIIFLSLLVVIFSSSAVTSQADDATPPINTMPWIPLLLLGDEPPPLVSNTIAGGDYHSLALKSDGTVVAWGDNVDHQCDIPPGLTNVVAVATLEYGLRFPARSVARTW